MPCYIQSDGKQAGTCALERVNWGFKLIDNNNKTLLFIDNNITLLSIYNNNTMYNITIYIITIEHYYL